MGGRGGGRDRGGGGGGGRKNVGQCICEAVVPNTFLQ